MDLRPLTQDEEYARLEALNLAERLIGPPFPFTCGQVQKTYDALRAEAPDWSEAQIGLGMAFGELIRRVCAMDWVRVCDDLGEETALCVADTQVCCFPVSMIQKRFFDAQPCDIVRLRDDTVDAVNALLASGDYAAR